MEMGITQQDEIKLDKSIDLIELDGYRYRYRGRASLIIEL
jgi:hypothetical protein